MVVYPHNEILFINKKWTFDTLKNMAESQQHYAEEAWHRRPHTLWFHLCDILEKINLIQGGEDGAHKGTFRGFENVLHLNCAGGYTSL